MKKKLKIEEIYAISLIVLTCLSIIPLIIISKYNHPAADDFSYSIMTFHEWKHSRSFWHLLVSAFDTTKHFWNTWQGLYSSAFFLAIQPSIFGERYYFLTGILMLFLIIFSTCFFFTYIIRKIAGGTILEGLTIGSAASFLMVQFMPSCVQGLYWYNGAVNYGLFYAILLFLICVSISLHQAHAKKKVIMLVILSCLLGFLLEGGNHVTAFMGILFVFCLAVYEMTLKRKGKTFCYVGILAFLIVCFLFNITSPGTKARQNSIQIERNVSDSIKMAVFGGIEKINSWIDLAPVVVVILIMPIFIKLIKKICKETNFKFSTPFLVFAGSVAWICAMYCPPAYAMGFLGQGRLHNVVWYNFVILLFLNVFYYTGWIMRKFDLKEERSDNASCVTLKWMCCALILLMGLYISKYDKAWSVRAVQELASGEVQSYSQQAYERYHVLSNSEGLDVILGEYMVKPKLLFFSDIEEDAENWKNVAVKDYYELNSIVLKK